MDYAAEKDLGIIVHAGEDVGLPKRFTAHLKEFLIFGNIFSGKVDSCPYGWLENVG